MVFLTKKKGEGAGRTDVDGLDISFHFFLSSTLSAPEKRRGARYSSFALDGGSTSHFFYTLQFSHFLSD